MAWAVIGSYAALTRNYWALIRRFQNRPNRPRFFPRAISWSRGTSAYPGGNCLIVGVGFCGLGLAAGTSAYPGGDCLIVGVGFGGLGSAAGASTYFGGDCLIIGVDFGCSRLVTFGLV
jgi:hypothetical protein